MEKTGKGSQQKGQQKGKSKGKSKSKNDGKSGFKGKAKNDGKGKAGGKSYDSTSGKGKGNSRKDACLRCGKSGHFAKDCYAWGPSVRNIQHERQQLPHPQASHSSHTPASSTAGGSPSSNGPQQQPATQFRVARIHECDIEFQNASDVSRHDEVVFDLRSPVTSPSRQGGSVRVMRYYIGDEPEVCMNCSVRAVIETMPDDSNMCSVLLDSGADASIFPACMAGLGTESDRLVTKLQDAQGNVIPIEAMRDIELRLADSNGKAVLCRETVAASRQIQQPIMCFGHLMANGWGVNAAECTLEHSCGVSVPIEMQNQFLAVRGWIRVLKEEQQERLVVRAVMADVMPDLSEMRIGWQLNDEGVERGKYFSNCFQDPTLVCPSLAGSFHRTTLVRDGGQWLIMELCERLDTLIDLSSEFHGLAGDRYALTIITDGEKPPQVMGFRMLDEGQQPLVPQDMPGEMEPAAPLAPEDAEIAGVDIDVQQAAVDGAEVQGNLFLSPEWGDHLNVNGVEIYKDTALATMRVACSFYQLSTSGGKKRCFERLWALGVSETP